MQLSGGKNGSNATLLRRYTLHMPLAANHGVRRNAKSKAEIKLQPPARRANNERGSKGSDCGNNDKIGRVAVARPLAGSSVRSSPQKWRLLK